MKKENRMTADCYKAFTGSVLQVIITVCLSGNGDIV